MAVARIVCLARLKAPQTIGAVYISKRHETSLTHARLKKGRGGRSSFSGIVATVFGASGFVGKYVVNALGKTGSQVIIPYRGDVCDVDRLKVAGDLGQVLLFPFGLKDDESIKKSLQYSNVVINLIGAEQETRNFSYNDVHVEGARRIARLAKECGVERLIHFSMLNASPNPQVIYQKEGSNILKTKYEGELAVKSEFPDATIFRPADIIGEEDRFVHQYAQKNRRKENKYVELWEKGERTVKRPINVADITKGVIAAIQDPSSAGNTYELVGPNAYYLKDLLEYMGRLMMIIDFKVVDISLWFRFWTKYIQPFVLEKYKYNMDKIEKDHITDRLTEDGLTLEDLGVVPECVDNNISYLLKVYRQSGYYSDYKADIADIDRAPPVTDY